jgi:hypothetical protein
MPTATVEIGLSFPCAGSRAFILLSSLSNLKQPTNPSKLINPSEKSSNMTATDQPLEKFTQGDFDRFSIQHEWIKGCIGGCSALVRAPIDLSKPGLRVLDAATANGTMAPPT